MKARSRGMAKMATSITLLILGLLIISGSQAQARDAKVTAALLEPSEVESFTLIKQLAGQGVLNKNTYHNLQVQLGNHLKDTLYLRVLQELYWDGTLEREAYRQLVREYAMESWLNPRVTQESRKTWLGGTEWVTKVSSGDPLQRYLERVKYAKEQVVLDEEMATELMVTGVEASRGTQSSGSFGKQIDQLAQIGLITEQARANLISSLKEGAQFIPSASQQPVPEQNHIQPVSYQPENAARAGESQAAGSPSPTRYTSNVDAQSAYNSFYEQGLPPAGVGGETMAAYNDAPAPSARRGYQNGRAANQRIGSYRRRI